METDSNNEIIKPVKAESTRGWTWLYVTVVGALAAQIVFFAWLTDTFE